MLFSVVLGVMVVMAMVTLPLEETSTQVTSAEMVVLPLVTMAMVALEEMPLEVSLDTLHGAFSSQTLQCLLPIELLTTMLLCLQVAKAVLIVYESTLILCSVHQSCYNAPVTTLLVLQATTILAWALLVLEAVATLWLVVLGVMVATTMATLPMEEASTQATSAATVELLQATTATVAMEALPLVVSLSSHYNFCLLRATLTSIIKHGI